MGYLFLYLSISKPMIHVVFGTKKKQTQAFLTDGTRVPVSVVAVTDIPVVGTKTIDKNGYTAIQVGIGSRKKAGKNLLGVVKKHNLKTVPYAIREVRVTADETLPIIGETISVDAVLKAGDIVKVTGISKGKGFAGVVKRHNFRGGPRTHGQSDRERAPGSIGQTTTPGRVYRGKRMAGRMGHEQVSVTNLQVIAVTDENGMKAVLVKGLIPGAVNSMVRIEKTGELSEKKFVPLLVKEETKAIEVDNQEVKVEESAAVSETTEQVEGQVNAEEVIVPEEQKNSN